MVERAERQDAEPGRAVGDRPGGGADRAVAAADDQQRIAAFDDRLAARFGLAAIDQLDLGGDPGTVERGLDLVGDRVIGRGRATAAVDEDGGSEFGQLAGPMRNAANLLPSRSRK